MLHPKLLLGSLADVSLAGTLPRSHNSLIRSQFYPIFIDFIIFLVFGRHVLHHIKILWKILCYSNGVIACAISDSISHLWHLLFEFLYHFFFMTTKNIFPRFFYGSYLQKTIRNLPTTELQKFRFHALSSTIQSFGSSFFKNLNTTLYTFVIQKFLHNKMASFYALDWPRLQPLDTLAPGRNPSSSKNGFVLHIC